MRLCNEFSEGTWKVVVILLVLVYTVKEKRRILFVKTILVGWRGKGTREVERAWKLNVSFLVLYSYFLPDVRSNSLLVYSNERVALFLFKHNKNCGVCLEFLLPVEISISFKFNFQNRRVKKIKIV